MDQWKWYYSHLTTKPEEQRQICSRLLSWWRGQTPPGRFVKESIENGDQVQHELNDAEINTVLRTYLKRRVKGTMPALDEEQVNALRSMLHRPEAGAAATNHSSGEVQEQEHVMVPDIAVDQATGELEPEAVEPAANQSSDVGQDDIPGPDFDEATRFQRSSPTCSNKERQQHAGTWDDALFRSRACWQKLEREWKPVRTPSVRALCHSGEWDGTLILRATQRSILARRHTPQQALSTSCHADSGNRKTDSPSQYQYPPETVPLQAASAPTASRVDVEQRPSKRPRPLPETEKDDSFNTEPTPLAAMLASDRNGHQEYYSEPDLSVDDNFFDFLDDPDARAAPCRVDDQADGRGLDAAGGGEDLPDGEGSTAAEGVGGPDDVDSLMTWDLSLGCANVDHRIQDDGGRDDDDDDPVPGGVCESYPAAAGPLCGEEVEPRFGPDDGDAKQRASNENHPCGEDVAVRPSEDSPHAAAGMCGAADIGAAGQDAEPRLLALLPPFVNSAHADADDSPSDAAFARSFLFHHPNKEHPNKELHHEVFDPHVAADLRLFREIDEPEPPRRRRKAAPNMVPRFPAAWI
jgi:hypothetical protein